MGIPIHEGAESRPLLISYTIFPDVWPKTKMDRSDVPWKELVSRIRASDAYPDKAHCPLVSLCEYGSLLSGSAKQPILRHAQNIVRAYGAELDYDGEAISPERGAALLEAARIQSVIYTSPSHTPAKPRWRAILPFSEPAPPEKRAEYLGRANRALGGIASRESFTLSQSFYIGRVRGADYQVYEIAGRCIDLASDLEPQYYTGFKANGTHARDQTTDEQLRRNITEGHDRHQSCLSLSSRLAAKGMSADDIAAVLVELLGSHSVNAEGVNFTERVPGYAETAVRKYGESRGSRSRTSFDPIVDQDGVIQHPAPARTPEEARIDELVRIDDIAYDRIREKVAEELGIRVRTLDDARGARQDALKPAKPKNVVRGPFVEPAGFNDTDIANGVRLIKRHGADLRYTAATDWLVWDGTRWKIDEKSIRVQALAKDTALTIFEEVLIATNNRDEIFKHAKYSESTRGINGMIFMAKSEPGIPGELSEFDRHPMLLNLSNGTLNLTNGELKPHDRGDGITKITRVEYHQHAECPQWKAFLEHATGINDSDFIKAQEGLKLYKYLQRAAGYCLTGLVTEQVLLFIHGNGGRGKSVFSEVLYGLMGEYAIVASPTLIMVQHAKKQIANDVAALRGVRLAIMNETEQGQKFDEAQLKDLTGGDSLKGEFKYKEAFNFSPTHKLMIRGNHKPLIKGRDEGIWRRLHLVPFDRAAPEVKNKHLAAEIIRDELPGVLKWAIEGCLEWQRLDGLNPPEQVVKAVEEYRAESDSLGHFIAECCESDPLEERKLGRKFEATSHFFKRYQKFCAINGLNWISSNELPHEMEKLGYVKKRKNSGFCFLGISLIVPMDRNFSESEYHENQ